MTGPQVVPAGTLPPHAQAAQPPMTEHELFYPNPSTHMGFVLSGEAIDGGWKSRPGMVVTTPPEFPVQPRVPWNPHPDYSR
jgi:hypothetical protein